MTTILSFILLSLFSPSLFGQFYTTPTDFSNVSKAIQELSWLEGTWELKSETTTIRTHITRSPGGFYLFCYDMIQLEDATKWFSAFRIISWNPISELFQSAIFCRDGSVGSGQWEKYDQSWVVATRMILANAQDVTSLDIYTPVENGFTWRSVSRTVNNVPLPDIGPVTAKKISLDSPHWITDLPFPATAAADE